MVMGKNCKVIATYFGPRRYFPRDINDTIDLIKEVIENEINIDPGVDLDVILVNHDFGNPDVINFLDTINGINLNRGKLIVLNRPWESGTGMSYSSYNYAFQMYKDSYDYWFFTEDDVITILPDYYRIAIDQLESDGDNAFIGCHRCILEEGVPVHAHSGCGLTSKKFIEEAISSNGGTLPYSNLPMPEEVSNLVKNMDREKFLSSSSLRSWYRSAEVDGEIAFTNIYSRIGFNIKNLETPSPVVKVYQQDNPYYL
jgi:hypothetical protein